MTRGRRIAVWIAAGLAAVVFVGSGAAKLLGAPGAAESFARWQLPAWVRYPVGAGEVIAGAALLVPRAALVAGGTLVVLMAGAAVVHLRTPGEAPMVAAPVILGAMVGWVTWSRRSAAG